MNTLLVLVFIALSVPCLARDRGEVRLFRSKHPCPATQRIDGPCPGYVVDHVIPICAGGPDRLENMQWQSHAQARIKDRIEIRYCRCLSREIGACK